MKPVHPIQTRPSQIALERGFIFADDAAAFFMVKRHAGELWLFRWVKSQTKWMSGRKLRDGELQQFWRRRLRKSQQHLWLKETGAI